MKRAASINIRFVALCNGTTTFMIVKQEPADLPHQVRFIKKPMHDVGLLRVVFSSTEVGRVKILTLKEAKP